MLLEGITLDKELGVYNLAFIGHGTIDTSHEMHMYFFIAIELVDLWGFDFI
jgi:hypothetical protein